MIDSSIYIPTVYFSEKYLDMNKFQSFLQNLTLPLNQNFFSSEQLEKQLYQDIELDNAQRQFVANDSAGLKSMTQL
mgnify:CR=1 FL=1